MSYCSVFFGLIVLTGSRSSRNVAIVFLCAKIPLQFASLHLSVSYRSFLSVFLCSSTIPSMVNEDVYKYCMLLYYFCRSLNLGGRKRWRSGVATDLDQQVNLRQARLFFDGWPCPGSIPGARHLCRYVTSHPGQLSLAIPSWVGALSKGQRAVT